MFWTNILILGFFVLLSTSCASPGMNQDQMFEMQKKMTLKKGKVLKEFTEGEGKALEHFYYIQGIYTEKEYIAKFRVYQETTKARLGAYSVPEYGIWIKTKECWKGTLMEKISCKTIKKKDKGFYAYLGL